MPNRAPPPRRSVPPFTSRAAARLHAVSASLLLALAVSVVDLRCEYLKEPLGIDVERPRLSWRLEESDPSRPGAKQSGYRIVVSSSLAALARDEGNLWYSGDVSSSRTTFIEYG